MTMYLPFFFMTFLTLVCASHLAVVEPLDNQLPLIARVGRYFSWTFSQATFKSTKGSLTYTASTLPPWLSFDPHSLTFYGTPGAVDEGNPRITVTASDGTSNVSSSFVLCVTPYPSPVPNLPISAQFRDQNPSLSSVFALAPYSGIQTEHPALRVPPGWSFSIGFEGNTFNATNDLFYYVRLLDGTSLPHWASFDSRSFTLNGVAPPEATWTPLVVPMKFIASDQEGYSAQALPFDLVIAPHELSLAASALPTINITAASTFNISLMSPDDFSGILVDGEAIQPSDIAELLVDTSKYESWLHYDHEKRILSGDSSDIGTSPDHKPCLPVFLTTVFNQSVATNYTVAVVPSYFSKSNLAPLKVELDTPLTFDLSQYFSNTAPRTSVNLTASFEPSEAKDWLAFDPASGNLSGVIPRDSSTTQCSATFTAYSESMHSISHAYLPIIISPSEDDVKGVRSHRHKLSAAARARLVLAMKIIFGTIGGLCFLAAFLAVFRHCARVDDTAISGEEGRNAWSMHDKKWYGMISPKASVEKPHDYGWTDWLPNQTGRPIKGSAEKLSGLPMNYGGIGLGLRSIPENSVRVLCNPPFHNGPTRPGVMKKKEFVSRIKQTVRQVSDKYRQTRNGKSHHPMIGKPILIAPSKSDDLPLETALPSSQPGSTFMTDSPSGSTAERSIPRRRADFAPPKSPAQVHYQDGATSREPSFRSECSFTSGILQVEAGERSQPTMTRPRLVPFTGASRVPAPRGASAYSLAKDVSVPVAKRVPSQKAKVWEFNSNDVVSTESMKKSGSGDELTMGLHYVQALGGDQVTVGSTPSVPTVVTTHVRSSFSSLESSHQGHISGGEVRRMLVRAGERFKFWIPIQADCSSRGGVVYEVRLANGGPLPKFVHHDLNLKRGSIEVYGMPGACDLGTVDVVVYASNGCCVARTVIDVVGRT
ncbi:hypothetical protein AX17_003551 [Amanita inopinata Kibby_2008]|nr:hypothetical protein AX17_003551 [Amanita inopinata Kibby_2008]